MGRSVNSRNRVFVQEPDGIRTEAFDPSLMKDPHLIIYHPVREAGQGLIVTNGDQTDTVYDFMQNGQTFEDALRTRTFEDDRPNWTPRISGRKPVSSESGGITVDLAPCSAEIYQKKAKGRK